MARYKQQGTARDGMGRILDDATITVYLAGTTTLATIYSQESGGSAISGSQVTAAADGSWSFWVDDGDYATSQKFKYGAARSGFVTRTWDDLTFFPAVDDRKVANSAGDATYDYLPNKLAVSAPVTKTVTTSGGAEVVQFGLSVGDYLTTSGGSVVLKFASAPANNDMLRVDTAGKQVAPRTPAQVLSDIGAEPADADILKADTTDQLTVGFTCSEHDYGSGSPVSSGTVTVDNTKQAHAYYTNGGAHTLAPDDVSGAQVIHVTNNASAGAITTSGWDVVLGDDLDTTDGHEFKLICEYIHATSILTVQALQ